MFWWISYKMLILLRCIVQIHLINLISIFLPFISTSYELLSVHFDSLCNGNRTYRYLENFDCNVPLFNVHNGREKHYLLLQSFECISSSKW